MFAVRNQYVCALADALVVIQGAKGSGVFHSAKFAKTQGIPIFAVPGDIKDPLSFAPNTLIESKEASAILSSDKIVEVVGKKKPNRIKNKRNNVKLTGLLQVIKDNHNSLSIDQLIALTGKSFGQIQQEMLVFEMEGLIKKQGARFVLTVD